MHHKYSFSLGGWNGSLDEFGLYQKAFSSKENTALLNSITHPAILELVKKEIEENKEKSSEMNSEFRESFSMGEGMFVGFIFMMFIFT